MSIKREIIDKYTFEDAKPFKRNTLDYVGVAFQFDTIVAFDEKQPEFYTNVKEDLPFKTENPFNEGSFQITISPDNSQFGFNQQNENFVEYIYTDDKDNPTIRVIITKKRIDFQCISPQGNYENFEDFLKKVTNIWHHFTDTYGKSINLMNLVLRKVNKISHEYANILNKNLLCEIDLYDDTQDVTSYKEFISKDNDGSTIEIRIGNIFNTNNTNVEKKIVYDFLIKQDNPSVLKIEEDYIVNTLKEYSKKIYNLYRYSVGESFVNIYLNKEG